MFTLAPSVTHAAMLMSSKATYVPAQKLIATQAITLPNEHPSTYALYIMTFTLTAFGNDVYLPTSLARSTGALRENSTQFGIENGDRELFAGGFSAGLLTLASSSPVDGYYLIKNGETKTVQVLVLYKNVSAHPDYYRMRIANLAYRLGSVQGTWVNETNSVEKYKTEEVFLGR